MQIPKEQIAISLLITVLLCLSPLLPFPLLEESYLPLLLSLPLIIWTLYHLSNFAPSNSTQLTLPQQLLWLFLTLSLSGFTLLHYVWASPQEGYFWQVLGLWCSGVLVGLYALRNLQQQAQAHELKLAHQLTKVLEKQTQITDSSEIHTIYAGAIIPIDGEVVDGKGLVNESLLTGNHSLQDKTKGNKIWAGSELELGQLRIRAHVSPPMIKSEEESESETVIQDNTYFPPTFLQQSLQHLRQLKKEASEKYAWLFHTSNLLLLSVLVWAGLQSFVRFQELSHVQPSLTDLQIWTGTWMRFTQFLLVLCPIALALSLPLLYHQALDQLFQKGIRLQENALFSKIARLKNFIFSKTGVLTTGHFRLQNFHSSLPSNEFKAILLALEQHRSHPYAKAIVQHFGEDVKPLALIEVQPVNGLGIMGKDATGNTYMAGAYNIASNFTNEDHHSIYVLKNGTLIGWLDLQDRLREEAEPCILQLKSQQLKPILLSGDRPIPVQYTARKTGIQDYHFQQLPQQKQDLVQQIQLQGATAILIAQNEEKELTQQASIGMELESLPDTQTETPNNKIAIQFFHHRLLLVNELIQTARSVVRKTPWSLIFGVVYHVLALTLVTMNVLTLLQAAVLGFLACGGVYLMARRV